jgi:ABC-2 type transport system ATP-binding protein
MVISGEALRVEDLSFRYGYSASNSLSAVSFRVLNGDRFGLFGPNGAGKTTLIHCITGILDIPTGKISLNHGLEKRFGIVPQDFAFYEELTASENLEFFGAIYGMTKKVCRAKIRELIAILSIDNKKQLRHLSGGMKRRVNLAIGVLHDPQLLFLDEPTVGVDVLSKKTILDFLMQMNQNGTTLFYTSHQLAEAQELCNNVALMNDGRIVAAGPLEELLNNNNSKDLESLFISLTGNRSVKYE